ncbi:MAG: TolB family protein, partial [Stenotrophobium sp.]
QGDWIMFESTRGHVVEAGLDSGLGIAQDALWVMRPDGSCPVQLTGPGLSGVLSDDFHAYWSPDGSRIAWVRLGSNFVTDNFNNSEFTMRVADFVDDGVHPPHLENTVIVGPRGEVYETELWAPDNSGFLFQYSDPGDNQQVYYLRLAGQGATPLHPLVERVTGGTPSWNEQALFTPDMSAVIFMSSRACTTCVYNLQTALEQALGVPDLPLGLDGILYPGLFFAAVAPADVSQALFETDLYLLDLHTRSLRRLTDDHAVIPEFFFDHTGRRLIWSEGSAPLGVRSTQTAYFQGLP